MNMRNIEDSLTWSDVTFIASILAWALSFTVGFPIEIGLILALITIVLMNFEE